jgi:hypothetical protein
MQASRERDPQCSGSGLSLAAWSWSGPYRICGEKPRLVRLGRGRYRLAA